MPHYPEEIEYSEKYNDDEYEYRHVTLPKRFVREMMQVISKGSERKSLINCREDLRILTEVEWRSIGIQQSRGWKHYEVHRPEPHILLFRRPLGTDPATGLVPEKLPQAPKEPSEQEPTASVC